AHHLRAAHGHLALREIFLPETIAREFRRGRELDDAVLDVKARAAGLAYVAGERRAREHARALKALLLGELGEISEGADGQRGGALREPRVQRLRVGALQRERLGELVVARIGIAKLIE